MRRDLVAHIKEQIESGRYVTEGKLKIVADRLLRDLSSFGPARLGLSDKLRARRTP